MLTKVVNIALNAWLILLVSDYIWKYAEIYLDGRELGTQNSDLFMAIIYSIIIACLMDKVGWYIIHIEIGNR